MTIGRFSNAAKRSKFGNRMDDLGARGFPDTIETERLLIRPIRSGDGRQINAAIRETYQDLHRWMEWAQHLPTVYETEGFCQRAGQDFAAEKEIALSAYLKGSANFVLALGLHCKDSSSATFEIGYWCRTSLQGQGYVSEAVRAVTRAGCERLGAKRIEIRCDSRNTQSRRVAERAGYRLVATIRNDHTAPNSQARDTLVFAMVGKDYKRLSED